MVARKPCTISLTRWVEISMVRHRCHVRGLFCPRTGCSSKQVEQVHRQIKDALYERVLLLVVLLMMVSCVVASQQHGTPSRAQHPKSAENTCVWSICIFNCKNQNKNTNMQAQTQARTNLVRFFAVAPDCWFTNTQSATNTNTDSLSEGFIASIRLWP